MKPLNLKKAMLGFSLVVLVAVSCKKDPPANNNNNNNNGPDNDPRTTHSDAKLFIESKAPKMQNFTLNAASGGMITGTGGTKVFFPASALLKDGIPATGNVNITLKEIRSKKDMMAAGIFTVTDDGNILESDGMFFLNAEQGGTNLTLGAALTIIVPPVGGNLDMQMGVFRGAQDTGKEVRWQRDSVVKVNDSASSMAQAYVFNWWEFGFCNIDRYVDPGNCSSDLTIDIPAGDSIEKSSCMIVFSDLHSEASTYALAGKFKTPYCLPKGKSVKLLYVTIKNNKLYYSLSTHTTAATMNFTVPAGTLISEDDLEDIMDNL